jgi:hypothetical protein
MQSPVFPIVGKRFITSIYDSPVKLNPLVNIVHDMIRSLTYLKINLALPIWQLEIKCKRICLSYSPSPGKYLPGRKECEQRREHFRRKLRFPSHKVVLVATESGARVMIDIVFEKRHLIRSTHFAQSVMKKHITGNVE